MNDRLWSRLLNEKIAHDVFNHEHISRIVTHLRSESTAHVALVSYKGRAWVAENLKSVMHWAKRAWLGLRDVVRGLLEDGVPADRSHKYLSSAMYAAAFNDDEPLAEILLDNGEGAWKMDGAYGDALQLAAYKGSKNKSPNPFGHGPYGSPLGAAAAAGNDDIVRLCPHLRSPLFYAARSGRARVAKILLDSGEMRPNMDDDFNDTPLSVAVEHNHEDVVSVLLSSDAPTPLQIAATNGYANIVRMLLCRRDIEVGGRKVEKRPIFMAALNGHTEIANLLLTRDESHYVRLFLPWVASRGLVDMVKMALDSQIVNPNGHDREFRTALHHAVGQGREDLVRLLLQRNETNPNLEDSNRNLPIFRLLLDDERTSIGKSNFHGMTPLHVACKHGYLTFVESILAREDVNINALDAACQTPLCYAIDSNSDGVIQLLLENKSTDHSQPDNNQGKTPLYVAAKNGHSKLAVMLMQRYKASPNCWCDEFLATPLIMAAARGDLYLISALLKESAVDINEPNKLGHTALGVAASHAQAKAALKLLEQPDVDVHLWAEDGTTIFLMAAHGGHLDILTHLLAKGAHPGICNNIGETPIYVASEKGHYEAVLMLLAQPGVDPNQPTHFRETPLSVAARRGHVAVVRLLLEQGGVCFNPQRQSSQKLLSMVTNTAIEQMLMDAGDRFVGAP
ncbi:ankyrin repeat-containing domain protein [Aspergillus pseudocaelatus]|uniref:Ankyrin repeat-containing domain protein n=1 Tax=Aspergillus pseudocaelatus TaxID=1825620 RepID=A0ABQ6WQM6_9EURO|nr:ankyrin repeat-containing domain protein [Aspergillus pseudocaelatus]